MRGVGMEKENEKEWFYGGILEEARVKKGMTGTKRAVWDCS